MQKGDKFFEEKLRLISERKKILDAGSSRPWQKDMAVYQPWFAKTQYETLDIVPDSGATYIADIQKMPLPNSDYDAVICKAVLHIIPRPQDAIAEIHRVLKPGGLMLAYMPFVYPYHALPGGYGDYWRFSRDGIRELFKNFTSVEISPLDGYFMTMMNFIPVKFLRKILRPIARLLDRVLKTKSRNTTSGYYVFAIK